jgi:hypothetical protein
MWLSRARPAGPAHLIGGPGSAGMSRRRTRSASRRRRAAVSSRSARSRASFSWAPRMTSSPISTRSSPSASRSSSSAASTGGVSVIAWRRRVGTSPGCSTGVAPHLAVPNQKLVEDAMLVVVADCSAVLRTTFARALDDAFEVWADVQDARGAVDAAVRARRSAGPRAARPGAPTRVRRAAHSPRGRGARAAARGADDGRDRRSPVRRAGDGPERTSPPSSGSSGSPIIRAPSVSASSPPSGPRAASREARAMSSCATTRCAGWDGTATRLPAAWPPQRIDRAPHS